MAVALGLLASPAMGQSRVELFGALSIPSRAVRGVFTSDYVPTLESGGTVLSGAAGQTLQIDGGRPRGFLAGLTGVSARGIGLQLFVSRAAHSIAGANTPNRVQLNYLTRQPPNYIDREVNIDRSTDWPATTGEFALWRAGVNGLWRLKGRAADLTVGAGLLLSRVTGQFGDASYVEFHLGGHSTLFSEEALAQLQFRDTWHAGFNAGVEAAVHANAHLAFTAGIRWMSPPSELTVTTNITNADKQVFKIPAATVQQQIGTQPAKFSQWGAPVVTLGLRLR
jgi:hypothetical protein